MVIKKRFFVAIMAVLLILGCIPPKSPTAVPQEQQSPERIAFQALVTGQDIYLNGMTTGKFLYEQKVITKAQWDAFKAGPALTYYNAWMAADKAVQTWATMPAADPKKPQALALAEKAMTAFVASQADFVKLLGQFHKITK